MTRYLIALLVLLVGVAAGRSDPHREPHRPTAQPTATLAPVQTTPAPVSVSAGDTVSVTGPGWQAEPPTCTPSAPTGKGAWCGSGIVVPTGEPLPTEYP